MKTIKITEETESAERMACALEVIAIMIREGFTSGYNPTWTLSEVETEL